MSSVPFILHTKLEKCNCLWKLKNELVINEAAVDSLLTDVNILVMCVTCYQCIHEIHNQEVQNIRTH